jgi:hypothetical protein
MAKEKVEGLTTKVLPPEFSTSKGDKPKSTDDIVYPSAPIVDIYADGSAFSIHDNQKLYEIIKVVKNIIDRQFFNQGKRTLSFAFNINVLNKLVEFIMTFNNKTENEKENLISHQGQDDYLDFASEIANVIEMSIRKKYEDSVEIERQVRQVGMDAIEEGITEVRIIVKEKNNEEEK